jgi:hypothetical protein
MWREERTEDGITYREAVPPGPDRDAIVEAIRTELMARASTLDVSIEALRSLVAAHEPVEFINAIAIPTSMAFLEQGTSPDDAPETVTWAAKIEYLVGLALSAPPGTGQTPTEATD